MWEHTVGYSSNYIAENQPFICWALLCDEHAIGTLENHSKLNETCSSARGLFLCVLRSGARLCFTIDGWLESIVALIALLVLRNMAVAFAAAFILFGRMRFREYCIALKDFFAIRFEKEIVLWILFYWRINRIRLKCPSSGTVCRALNKNVMLIDIFLWFFICLVVSNRDSGFNGLVSHCKVETHTTMYMREHWRSYYRIWSS